MARAVVFLALVLAAISLWVAAAPVVERIFGQGTAMASSPVPQAPAEAAAADLGPVLDFAPFGAAEGSLTAAVPDGADTGLILLGITMAQSPDRSRAIIVGGAAPTANYGIGEAITTDAILTGIFADHVTFDLGGQDQALYFQPGDAGVAPTPTDTSTIKIVEVAENDSLIGRYRAEILQDAPGLIARLGLEATDKGYLVTDGAASEILQAGLLPGDQISAVNGKALGNMDSDPALFDEVAALGHANLSVQRDGTTLLMTFPLE